VPLLLLFLPVLVILAAIVLIPVSLVQRYRLGTSRQRARGWLSAVNLAGLALSSLLFLVSAAFTSIWIPQAFTYAAGGVVTGGVLGLLGLALTRWERTPVSLHYTPNRWLVLAITLVVTGRLLYGFWRAWHSWQVAADTGAWLMTAGVAGSLAAGAVVLGYYLTYWAGVRTRLRRIRGG
jgi:hypothetical protein